MPKQDLLPYGTLRRAALRAHTQRTRLAHTHRVMSNTRQEPKGARRGERAPTPRPLHTDAPSLAQGNTLISIYINPPAPLRSRDHTHTHSSTTRDGDDTLLPLWERALAVAARLGENRW